MKYEIIMRDTMGDHKCSVTASLGEAYMFGDFEYVRRCLAQCLFRVQDNGFKIVRHIYRDFNGQVMLCGFLVEGGQSYSIRKAIKQAKFDSLYR